MSSESEMRQRGWSCGSCNAAPKSIEFPALEELAWKVWEKSRFRMMTCSHTTRFTGNNHILWRDQPFFFLFLQTLLGHVWIDNLENGQRWLTADICLTELRETTRSSVGSFGRMPPSKGTGVHCKAFFCDPLICWSEDALSVGRFRHNKPWPHLEQADRQWGPSKRPGGTLRRDSKGRICVPFSLSCSDFRDTRVMNVGTGYFQRGRKKGRSCVHHSQSTVTLMTATHCEW